jgi:outer membrane protein
MSNQASPKHRRRSGPIQGRRLALILLAAILGAWTVPTLAQDGTRIGYVDMKRLFDNAPQLVAAREALDQEFRPRDEALMADDARLERMRQRLVEAEDLDAEARFEMEREIRNLSRSIDRRREDLSEELRFRTNARKQEIEATIDLAVQQVAEERGFDLILNSPVAYASPAIDITDQILQWLREDFEQNGTQDRP